MTTPYNVLVIGGGGREHALAWGLAKSESVAKVFVAPGNGGTQTFSSKVTNVSLNDFDAMAKFAVENKVELVVVGPEQPLVDGITTVFKKVGISVFGPSAKAAQIEGSKAFSKDFMRRHNIPTASYAVFTDIEAAKKHVKETYKGGDLVIKASGLAAGKGVLLPETIDEAIAGLQEVMVSKEFGSAGDEVVIEELLIGEEVSVLAFSDGYTVIPCPGAQDHKRIFEGDKGPNTGGMGAYAPAPIYTPTLQAEVLRTVLKPTVDGMRREGYPFVGILYAGLMLTASGPKVLEFNCRFGDPETQVVIPLLDSDLAEVMKAAAEGRLDSVDLKFKSGAAATVVAAAGGYPGSYPKGKEITIGRAPTDIIVFHAGTAAKDGKLVTAGGRVLAVTATADNLEEAIKKAVSNVSLIKFEGMQYRRDIGHRALKLLESKKTGGLTYADAGVSIDTGNLLVEKIKPLVKATRRSGADADIGGLSGTDGVGTKLKIAHSANIHSSIGIDLVAMSVNDVLVQGAEPLFFLDYYACSKLEADVAKDVVAGIAEGCIQSGCALIGGETAEMPGMYSPGDYDLAGFVVGAVKRDELLPKMDLIIPGSDVILGIPSSGIHSNGYSLVRHIVALSGLTYTSTCPWNSKISLGEALLTPTRIYVKELLPVIRKKLVKAMSHITGGGFTDNIPRCLPKGVGVEVDVSTYQLPDVFKWLKAQGKITNAEFARTFNCGIGMVLVVAKEDVAEVTRLINAVGGPVVPLGRVVNVRQGGEEVKAATTRRTLIEKREQELRRKEFQREDLVKLLNQDNLFRSNLSSDERVDNTRRLRDQRAREDEMNAQIALQESYRQKQERQQKRLAEIQLVEEIERRQNEQAREENLRRSIRENSVELRELEKKLNYAYMNKERALQIQEKRLTLQKEKSAEAERISEMNRQLEILRLKEMEQEQAKYERSLAYKEALQTQLSEHETRKLGEYEQFLKEKAMVDEIVRKILEEDAKEQQKRLEKQRETKQFIEDFMEERIQWREQERQRQIAENQKIEAYAKLQHEREEDIRRKKKTMADEKNVIYDKLATEMERQDRAKAELEQLRIELYQEEEEEKARARDQEILRSRIMKRLELIDAYQRQVEDKQRRLQKEREEEEEFRRKMMEKFANDERLEQMNTQRRRIKQLEHKRAVDALVQERRKLVQREYEQQLAEQQQESMLENYRQQVIEQERQRLLHEHASKLLGYLPKGVLRDSQDLKLFDEEFRRNFEKVSQSLQ
ncbi:hypothetical protein HDU76_007345 [Blyttiomyces sp. JEL0837]|nr:hypothetical protein HDU76_007345 [Blyttiomyces sp. JEL0837]